MDNIRGFILNMQDNSRFCGEILSYPVLSWETDALKKSGASDIKIVDNISETECSGLPCVAIFKPVPAISAETVRKMLDTPNSIIKMADGSIAAAFSANGSFENISEFRQVEPCDNREIIEAEIKNCTAITAYLREKVNTALCENGVLMPDMNSCYISPEAVIESGVSIMPGSVIRGKTVIHSGAFIGYNCIIENAVIENGAKINCSQIYGSTVGANTTVGPFAYIRPDCIIGSEARIGDFVELKNAHIGNKTKVSHLTYIGDARVGSRVNFGCGTVTVNYNGKKKYITTVGDDAFIGCNTNLVAPVTIGSGAYTAAGSTVTVDIPDNALVIARPRETIKENWVIKQEETDNA